MEKKHQYSSRKVKATSDSSEHKTKEEPSIGAEEPKVKDPEPEKVEEQPRIVIDPGQIPKGAKIIRPSLVNVSLSQESVDKESSEPLTPIQTLVIKPVGFPIQPGRHSSPAAVKISDEPGLFQAYAVEQWMGLEVEQGDYIFDQLLIPDYAFKVMLIAPSDGQIVTGQTKFEIDAPELKKSRKFETKMIDIVGLRQAKKKAQVIIRYLQNPEQFGEWGPRNILFHGPPGTGKTLMAKALATESDAYFIARKGTTLIGHHVGDGAARIHSLYQHARENAPSIIFIDEIDAIGLSRSFQNVRGDVVEVSTALLAELDGIDPNLGVVTIAATNSQDLLDPGLRNRFEEELMFPLPNEEERIQLLELFSQQIPLPMEADLKKIATAIPDWSGRSIHEKLMKVAIHRAMADGIDKIDTNLLLNIIKEAGNSVDNSKSNHMFL